MAIGTGGWVLNPNAMANAQGQSGPGGGLAENGEWGRPREAPLNAREWLG